MKHLSFAYQFLIASSIVVILVCLFMSCTRRESKGDNSEPNTFNDSIGSDKCKACSIDSFSVKSLPASDGKTTLIQGAVAITFFHQVRLADKYDKKNSYDTLIKMFKMRHSGDRNVIYALRDQYFYFVNKIKPILMDNSIEIIDSISASRFLEFRASNVSIFVNPKEYKNQDGVLFFVPGKKPLFWTADREEKYCRGSHEIVTQYFLCSASGKVVE